VQAGRSRAEPNTRIRARDRGPSEPYQDYPRYEALPPLPGKALAASLTTPSGPQLKLFYGRLSSESGRRYWSRRRVGSGRSSRDEGPDLDHEVSDGGERAAVDGLAFDDAEPHLDQV
jgi:hypothetical protein